MFAFFVHCDIWSLWFLPFLLVVADIPRLMREHYAVQRRHKKSNHSACVSAHVHQPRIAKRILVAHLPSSKSVCSMPFASPVCSINFAQSMSEGHMVQNWRQSLWNNILHFFSMKVSCKKNPILQSDGSWLINVSLSLTSSFLEPESESLVSTAVFSYSTSSLFISVFSLWSTTSC